MTHTKHMCPLQCTTVQLNNMKCSLFSFVIKENVLQTYKLNSNLLKVNLLKRWEISSKWLEWHLVAKKCKLKAQLSRLVNIKGIILKCILLYFDTWVDSFHNQWETLWAQRSIFRAKLSCLALNRRSNIKMWSDCVFAIKV